MSQFNAGECHICTAHSDYCQLECADGQEIDCRDLHLVPEREKLTASEWRSMQGLEDE